MSDPLSQIAGSINANLSALGADMEVGFQTTIDATLRFGPLEHETGLHVRITEDGWELIDPDAQARRIEQEIRDKIDPDKIADSGEQDPNQPQPPDEQNE